MDDIRGKEQRSEPHTELPSEPLTEFPTGTPRTRREHARIEASDVAAVLSADRPSIDASLLTTLATSATVVADVSEVVALDDNGPVPTKRDRHELGEAPVDDEPVA